MPEPQTTWLSYEVPGPRIRRWRLGFSRGWRRVTGVLSLGVIFGAVGLLTQTYLFGVLAMVSYWTLLMVTDSAVSRLRRRQAKALIGYIEQGVRLGLPIPAMLTAAAAGETKQISRRLLRMNEALARGEPLSIALRDAAPQTPMRSIGLIAVAEQSGDLPATLRRLRDEAAGDDRRGLWRDFGLFGSYLLILLLIACFIMFAIDIFVWPKYQQISRDFRAPVWSIVATMSDSAAMIANIVLVPGLIIFAGLAGRAMGRLLMPSPSRLKQVYFLDWLIWNMPVLGTIHRNRDHSDALATMAASLNGGESIEQAIENASRLHVNEVLRQRLRNCRDALGHGQPLGEAMAESHLSPLIVGLCASGVRANNLRSTLLFLARYYRGQFSRSRETLYAIAAPAVAGAGGLLVLATWAWLYGPMLEIIDKTELWTKLW